MTLASVYLVVTILLSTVLIEAVFKPYSIDEAVAVSVTKSFIAVVLAHAYYGFGKVYCALEREINGRGILVRLFERVVLPLLTVSLACEIMVIAYDASRMPVGTASILALLAYYFLLFDMFSLMRAYVLNIDDVKEFLARAKESAAAHRVKPLYSPKLWLIGMLLVYVLLLIKLNIYTLVPKI